MNHEHKIVLDGLELGMQKHVAELFRVLMAAPDPDALKRFELGLRKAIRVYGQANEVALDLENSATGGDGTPTRGRKQA